MPLYIFSQAPNLGTAANFVLFSSVGAVTNTGISHLTGHVGTNNGSSTGFGNVDGVMHDGDGTSGQCATDLTAAYNQLNSTIPNFFLLLYWETDRFLPLVYIPFQVPLH